MLWGEPGTGKTLTAQRVREKVQESGVCNVRHWLQGDSEATRAPARVWWLHVRGVTDGMPPDDVLQAVRAFVRDETFVVDDATNAGMSASTTRACRVLTAHTDLGLPANGRTASVRSRRRVH